MSELKEKICSYATKISPFVGGKLYLTFSEDLSKLEQVEVYIENAGKCREFCEYAIGKMWLGKISPIHIDLSYSKGMVFDYVDCEFDPMDNVLVHLQFRKLIRVLLLNFVEEVNKNIPLWKKWHPQASSTAKMIGDKWELNKIPY